MRIYQEGNRLVIAEGKSAVWIEPWGANSLREIGRASCRERV